MKTTILALTMAGSVLATHTERGAAPAPHPDLDPTSPLAAALYWGDIDQDGLPDAIAVPTRGPARLLSNAGDGTFVDVSEARLLPELEGVLGVAWGDYDGDGHMDLFLARRAGSRLLRQSADGTLVDVSERIDPDRALSASEAHWLDIDGQGNLDLHVSGPGHESFWRNVDGWFEPIESLARTLRVDHAGPTLDGARPDPEAPATMDGRASAGQRFESSELPPRGAGNAGTEPLGARPGHCVPTLSDRMTGTCVQASSTPLLGALYPLGPEFNIDPAGNVGIGTVSSGPRFEVDLAAGEVARLGRATAPSEIQLRAGRLRSENLRFQILGQTLSGTARDISFGQADGDHDVTLTSAGRLGIGTSTPTARLDVMGDVLVDGDAALTGIVSAPRFVSTTVSGPPLVVASSLKVAGLHVGQLDGLSADAFSMLGTEVNTLEFEDDAVTSTRLGSDLELDGSLNADASTLAVNGATGRVGVGTAVPDRRLAVTDDLLVRNDLEVSDDLEVFDMGTFGLVEAVEGANGQGICTTRSPNGDYNGLLTTVQGSAGSRGAFSVRDSAGVGLAKVLVDSSGNGDVTGDVKNFVADNPDDPTTRLWYASLEGPEAAAYVRGTARLEQGVATIELPAHFRNVAATEGLTVTLTATSVDSRGLAAVEKSRERLVVREMFSGTGTYAFDWEVKAVRSGFEDYVPVRPASWSAVDGGSARPSTSEER